MRIRPGIIATVFELAYLALTTNLLLVLGCLPLLTVALTTDTTRSWPLLALLAPLCTPALCGAFAVFAAYTDDRSSTVATTFGRAWRASFRRASQLGALTTGALVVLGVDARVAWGHSVGAVAIPLLATAAVLATATALLALAVFAELPAARLRDALRVSLYLAVRHWPLTLLSLVVLVLLQTVFASRPAVALGLAAAPLLYVVWANSRFALRSVLQPAVGRPVTTGH
jgi:uncharacterized membrane protein YesL